MPDRRAIVNPVKGKKPPDTGSTAIIAATEADLRLLSRLAAPPVVERRKLYMSTLEVHADDQRRFTVVGPLVGAPYAAMVVDSLWAWGVKTILFFGWCGAISRRVKAGDIILPESAMVDEGTSGHYCDPSCRVALPSRPLAHQARLALQHHGTPFHEGAVWTTDAIFRETVEKVKHYQAKGALAVEMELSAVFTVAGFRKIEAAGMLVVSDELSDYQWRPGFKTPAFRSSREKACRAVLTLGSCLGQKARLGECIEKPDRPA
jgi:purine-nucleoside phosphorylase